MQMINISAHFNPSLSGRVHEPVDEAQSHHRHRPSLITVTHQTCAKVVSAVRVITKKPKQTIPICQHERLPATGEGFRRTSHLVFHCGTTQKVESLITQLMRF